MFHLLLFLIFGGICVAGAVNLLMQSHPINSALSLIVVMASLAVLYLLLGAEFVAAVQVIVYAGAIMVLFVITIMLLNAGAEERTKGSRVALWLGVPGVLVGGGLVAFTLLRRADQPSVPIGALPGFPDDIARLLFHEFLLPFEVTSVLILIAIMGAVVLASRPEVIARFHHAVAAKLPGPRPVAGPPRTTAPTNPRPVPDDAELVGTGKER